MLCFANLLRMNRRKEELIHSAIVMNSLATLRLRTADNPKATLFCFAQGINTSSYDLKTVTIENDFDTHTRLACTTMNYLCPKSTMEAEIVFV